MRSTTSVRSVSAALFASAAVALAYSCEPGAGLTSDAATGTTYWLAERTSEVDLQLVATEPTIGF